MSTLRRNPQFNDENAPANRVSDVHSTIGSGVLSTDPLAAAKRSARSAEKPKSTKQPQLQSHQDKKIAALLDSSSSTVMSMGSLLNDSSLLLDQPEREPENDELSLDSSPFSSKKSAKKSERRQTFDGGNDLLNALLNDSATFKDVVASQQQEREKDRETRRETMDGAAMDELLCSPSLSHGAAPVMIKSAPTREMNHFLDLSDDRGLSLAAERERHAPKKRDKDRRETIDATCMEDLLNDLEEDEEKPFSLSLALPVVPAAVPVKDKALKDSAKKDKKKERDRRETIDATCMDNLLNDLEDEEKSLSLSLAVPVSPAVVESAQKSSKREKKSSAKKDKKRDKDRRETIDAGCMEDLLNDLEDDEKPFSFSLALPAVSSAVPVKDKKKERERRETIDPACFDDLLDDLEDEEKSLSLSLAVPTQRESHMQSSQRETEKDKKKEKERDRRETMDAGCMDDLLNDESAVSLFLSQKERESPAERVPHRVSPPDDDNASVDTFALMGDVDALLGEKKREKNREREGDAALDVSEISALSDCTFATARTSLSLDMSPLLRETERETERETKREKGARSSEKKKKKKDKRERERRETVDTQDVLSLSLSHCDGNESERNRESDGDASLDTLGLLGAVADTLEDSPRSQRKREKKTRTHGEGESEKKQKKKKKARDSLSLSLSLSHTKNKSSRGDRESERESDVDDDASIATYALIDAVRAIEDEHNAEKERDREREQEREMDESDGSLIALEDLLRRTERDTETERDREIHTAWETEKESKKERDSSAKRKKKKRKSVSSPAPPLPLPLPTHHTALSYNAKPLPALPASALKSCLSAKKKRVRVSTTPHNALSQSAQQPAQYSVVFGSPEVAEFRKTSPSCSFTPMDRKTAKALFSLPPVACETHTERHTEGEGETEADAVTEENERILEAWDRLTNASESEVSLSPHSSPALSPTVDHTTPSHNTHSGSGSGSGSGGNGSGKREAHTARLTQQCRSFEAEAQQFFDEFVASSLSPIAERDCESDRERESDELSLPVHGSAAVFDEVHDKGDNKKRRTQISVFSESFHAAEHEDERERERERERAIVRSARRRRSKLMPQLDLSLSENENEERESERERAQRDLSTDFSTVSFAREGEGEGEEPTVTVTVALPGSLSQLLRETAIVPLSSLSHNTLSHNTLPRDAALSHNALSQDGALSPCCPSLSVSLSQCDVSRTVEIETDLHALLETLQHNAVSQPLRERDSEREKERERLTVDEHLLGSGVISAEEVPGESALRCESALCESAVWSSPSHSLADNFPQSVSLSPTVDAVVTQQAVHTTPSHNEDDLRLALSPSPHRPPRRVWEERDALCDSVVRDDDIVCEESALCESVEATTPPMECAPELSFTETKRRSLLSSDSFLSSPSHNKANNAHNTALTRRSHNENDNVTQYTTELPSPLYERVERESENGSESERETETESAAAALRERLKSLNTHSRSHSLAQCRTPGGVVARSASEVSQRRRRESLSQHSHTTHTHNVVAAKRERKSLSVSVSARERANVSQSALCESGVRRASLAHIALSQPQTLLHNALSQSVTVRESEPLTTLSHNVSVSLDRERESEKERERALTTVCEEISLSPPPHNALSQRTTPPLTTHNNVRERDVRGDCERALCEELSHMHATAHALYDSIVSALRNDFARHTLRVCVCEALCGTVRETHALSLFTHTALETLCESALCERDVSVFTQQALLCDETQHVLCEMVERDTPTPHTTVRCETALWDALWVQRCTAAVQHMRTAVRSAAVPLSSSQHSHNALTQENNSFSVVSLFRESLTERCVAHKQRVARERERLAELDALTEIANSLTHVSLTELSLTTMAFSVTLSPHTQCSVRCVVSERDAGFVCESVETEMTLERERENGKKSALSLTQDCEHALAAVLLTSDERRAPLSSVSRRALCGAPVSQIVTMLQKTMASVVVIRSTLLSLQSLLSQGGRCVVAAHPHKAVSLELYAPHSHSVSASVPLNVLSQRVGNTHASEATLKLSQLIQSIV